MNTDSQDNLINNEGENNKKKEKQQNKLLKIVMLVIIILLLLLCFRSCYKFDSTSNGAGITEIVEGDLDSIPRTVNDINTDSDINGLMFSTFLNKNIFVDENNRANLLIKNDKSNSYNAYVEYYMNDNLIYKTDIISPGYKQEYADFSTVKLNKGENDAKSVFCIIDVDGNKLNTVTIPIKITK